MAVGRTRVAGVKIYCYTWWMGRLVQRLWGLCTLFFPHQGRPIVCQRSWLAPFVWELELSWRAESFWQQWADHHHTKPKWTPGFSAALFSHLPAPVPGGISSTWISPLGVYSLSEGLFYCCDKVLCQRKLTRGSLYSGLRVQRESP